MERVTPNTLGHLGGTGNLMPASDDKRIEVAVRRAKVLEMRAAGYTLQEIADLVGLPSKSQVANDIRRALESAIEAEKLSVGQYRTQQLQQLDHMLSAAAAVSRTVHYAHSGGKIVQGPDGGWLVDTAPQMAAVRTMLRVVERQARILGLDAPVKVQADITGVRYEIVGVDPAEIVGPSPHRDTPTPAQADITGEGDGGGA